MSFSRKGLKGQKGLKKFKERFKGTGYFSFSLRGRPRGRSVLPSPNVAAISSCQSVFPNGHCRFKHSRTIYESRITSTNTVFLFFANSRHEALLTRVEEAYQRKSSLSPFLSPFLSQKATSKLLNNAFYATLCCQIKKLPWSDPALETRSRRRRSPSVNCIRRLVS